jgi:hypothetical protein
VPAPALVVVVGGGSVVVGTAVVVGGTGVVDGLVVGPASMVVDAPVVVVIDMVVVVSSVTAKGLAVQAETVSRTTARRALLKPFHGIGEDQARGAAAKGTAKRRHQMRTARWRDGSYSGGSS